MGYFNLKRFNRLIKDKLTADKNNISRVNLGLFYRIFNRQRYNHRNASWHPLNKIAYQSCQTLYLVTQSFTPSYL